MEPVELRHEHQEKDAESEAFKRITREEQLRDAKLRQMIEFIEKFKAMDTANDPADDALPRPHPFQPHNFHGYDIVSGRLVHDGVVNDNGVVPLLLVVPRHLRRAYIFEAHATLLGGHQGIQATYNRLRATYYWPRMLRDVAAFVQRCVDCQRFRNDRPESHGMLMPLALPLSVGQRWAIDFAGPLIETPNGNRYVLIMVEAASGWVEARSSPSADEVTAAQGIVFDILPRFGAPVTLLSDRGQAFNSNLILELLRLMNTVKLTTSAYHPQTDGLAENMVGRVMRTIAYFVNDNRSDWDVLLPLCLFAIRSAVNNSTGISPFEYLYGARPRMPGDIMQELPESLARLPRNDPGARMLSLLPTLQQLRDYASEQRLFAQARQSHYADISREPPTEYHLGQLVWLGRESVDLAEDGVRHSKFLPKWLGPYKIFNKINNNAYVIEGNNGVHRPVNVRLLKPYSEPLPELSRSGDIEAQASRLDVSVAPREADPDFVSAHPALPDSNAQDEDDPDGDSVYERPLSPPRNSSRRVTFSDPEAETDSDEPVPAPRLSSAGRPLRAAAASHRFARPQ